MKIKPSHRRDFMAYVDFNFLVNKSLNNPHYFCPAPYHFEKGNVEAIICFVEYESTGKMSGRPNNPDMLKLALDGKKLLNWHIEQWAEGIFDGTIVAWDIREHLFKLPEWVGIGLERQIGRLTKQNRHATP